MWQKKKHYCGHDLPIVPNVEVFWAVLPTWQCFCWLDQSTWFSLQIKGSYSGLIKSMIF